MYFNTFSRKFIFASASSFTLINLYNFYNKHKITVEKSPFNFNHTLFKINRPNKAFCDIPINKKPYLGCSIRLSEDNQYQGMKILLVKSDSPAEKSGLRVKDIILEIDGKPITSINDYNAAIGSLANKKMLKISRIENGKPVIIQIAVEFIFTE